MMMTQYLTLSGPPPIAPNPCSPNVTTEPQFHIYNMAIGPHDPQRGQLGMLTRSEYDELRRMDLSEYEAWMARSRPSSRLSHSHARAVAVKRFGFCCVARSLGSSLSLSVAPRFEKKAQTVIFEARARVEMPC